MAVNPATEAMYIANPLRAGGTSSLFSTHPPIQVRIEKLRQRDLRAGIVW
jgi:heat shock protein HtpX